MHRKILASMLVFMFLPLIGNSFASTSGSINEVVSNEKMQIYVVSVQETEVPHFEGGKSVEIELILKNVDDEPRAFNPFFAKLIDTNGNDWKASALLGTIMPIRIAPNDIIRGVLIFPVHIDVNISMLVWEEFGGTKLSVDLTQTKRPADPLPRTTFVFSSSKGKVVSDGIMQLTIHDELLNKSPRYYHVDVSIKNLDQEPLSYNFGFSFVKDQDGFLYPTSLENFQYLKNPLKKGELQQGEEVRGEILFPLPDTVTNVMLIYDERFGGGSYFAVPEFPVLLIPVILAFCLIMIFTKLKNQRVHSA